jgi:hypothetical protein
MVVYVPGSSQSLVGDLDTVSSSLDGFRSTKHRLKATPPTLVCHQVHFVYKVELDGREQEEAFGPSSRETVELLRRRDD